MTSPNIISPDETAQSDEQQKPAGGSSPPPPASPASDAKTVSKQVRPPRQYGFGRVLAFSIRPDSVEMAAARRSAGRSQVTDLRKVYLTGQEASYERRDEFFLENIRQFTEQHGGRRAKINLSIHGAQTVFRMIDMPSLPRHKLDSAVYFEAKKRIPFPIDDCIWDYRVIARVKRGAEERVQVAVLAVTASSIEDQLALFERLGLQVNNVYSAYDSVGQLLTGTPGYDPTKDTALIDVEQRGTHISYYRGSELQFYHVASVGSSALPERTGSGPTDGSRFTDFANSLAREIQNSLDYYSGQYAGRFGNQVYVQGDLAYAEELVNMLQDQFGLQFCVFPHKRMPEIEFASTDIAEAVPVCLNALSAVACNVKLANLIPERMVIRRHSRRQSRLAVAALTAVALSLGTLGVNQYRQVESERARLSTLESQIAEFKRTDLFPVYRDSQQQLFEKTADFARLQPINSYVAFTLKELTQLTPESVKFTLLRLQPAMEGRNLNLHGTVSSASTPPEVLLADWIERLNQSALFDSIHVDRHVKRPVGDGFELEFILAIRGEA